MNLRTRMIAASILVTTAIFMALALVTLNYLERKQYETVIQQQEASLLFTANEIDAALKMLKEQLMASARVMPAAATESPEEATRFLQSRTGLNNLFNRQLFLITPNGLLQAESKPLPVPRQQNYSSAPFFLQTVATLKSQISEPFQCCMEAGEFHIIVSAPVIDEHKQLRGILAGAFSIHEDNFLTRFSRATTGKESFIRLATSQKTMILHSKKGLLMKEVSPGHAALFDKALRGFTGTETLNGWKERPLVTSVTALKTVNWVLAASYPVDVIMQPVKTVRNFFMAAAAISIIALAIIISVYAGYLTTPLQRFTLHLEELQAKSGKERLFKAPGHDEVAKMAQTFNGLITTLDAQTDELHLKNATLEDEMAERHKLQDALQLEQKALAEMNTTLAQLVAEEVEKNREKDHQLMQQERLVIMGELLSAISHQWRQPLNNISLLIQQLQMEYAEGALTREMMDIFAEQTLKMLTSLSHTLENFRNFFQADKKQVEFSPGERVEQVISLSRPGLESAGIRVIFNQDGSSLMTGHCNEFTRVVMAILANARDILVSRNVQEPTIEVNCVTSEDGTCVTVRDNAGGIGQESLERIFDPYYTTKFMSQGAGLGLFVCKTIVERVMHGSLTASNIATGAEFRIEIPAHLKTRRLISPTPLLDM